MPLPCFYFWNFNGLLWVGIVFQKATSIRLRNFCHPYHLDYPYKRIDV